MSAIYEDRALADKAVEKLRIYAQPQRLMILSCLLRGERTVSEIDTATSIGQPALSQQLAELRRGEMVKTRREAKQVYYDLADEQVALCVRSMEAIFSGAVANASDLRTAIGEPPKAAPTLTVAGAAAFARIER
ncbi:ArsR/SmtB family transcription factor [Sphingopyxis sp. H115]|uniref:ArsR/SmtB family transcription factor n=1 Tax=Sphingopyxis sp. H115 TaxID=1759073 RepID=UPI000B16C606|nr:metalloregulator ArsR/SmtB family transcription factor [Sphingopyxis sp. H115]